MEEWSLQQDFLKYKGVWDMKKVYQAMQAWFSSRGYRFMEEMYKEKPPETEIKWAAKRLIDDYYLYHISLKFHIWDMENVEVVKDGKKKVLQQGRMKITFSAKVVTDYSGRWEASVFKKWLEKVYNKAIIRRDIEFKHMDNLYYVLYGLHEHTKQLLGMETSGGAY